MSLCLTEDFINFQLFGFIFLFWTLCVFMSVYMCACLCSWTYGHTWGVHMQTWRPEVNISSWTLESEGLSENSWTGAGTAVSTGLLTCMLSSWEQCDESHPLSTNLIDRFAPQGSVWHYYPPQPPLPHMDCGWEDGETRWRNEIIQETVSQDLPTSPAWAHHLPWTAHSQACPSWAI